MDHQIDLVGELQPDDIQQIAGMVGSDGKPFGRVGFWLQVDNGDGVSEGVKDDIVGDSVSAGGTVDLHITTYRNTKPPQMEWRLDELDSFKPRPLPWVSTD